MHTQIENLNIRQQKTLITPGTLKARVAVTPESAKTVMETRESIANILHRTDHRLLMIVGPCSIHDEKIGLDYAHRLKELADEVADSLLIVMRVYFEKPRTNNGWKGLINDPHLNGSFDIEEGLYIARKLLSDITRIGMPTATEALDPIAPQYYHDMIAWSAIGARTTESQTHRELASGLSCPVGFKNSTDGGLRHAINALHTASRPHCFIGIDKSGQVALTETLGNPNVHIVLRGGDKCPNYDSHSIAHCEDVLSGAQLPCSIMVDCSHANSRKDHTLQPLVLQCLAEQIIAGNQSIIGMMLESNIYAGKQDTEDMSKDQLRYGVSITDACIDWDTTQRVIRELHSTVHDKLSDRHRSRRPD